MAFMHTTTRDPKTWLRLGFLALGAWLFARIIPYAGPDSLDFVAPRAVDLSILFSITVGFLMYKTLNRRTALDEHIALELNKVRRIFHLSFYIRRASPELDDWFQRIRSAIIDYLEAFRSHGFEYYQKGNPLFRAITYTIYSLPSRGKAYNNELFNALMMASGQATEAREYIRSKKADLIGRFPWMVVIVISLAFGAFIAASTPHDSFLRTVVALTIFCLFLVLQLIAEHDRDNAPRERALAKRYLDDLKAIETAQTEY